VPRGDDRELGKGITPVRMPLNSWRSLSTNTTGLMSTVLPQTLRSSADSAQERVTAFRFTSNIKKKTSLKATVLTHSAAHIKVGNY